MPVNPTAKSLRNLSIEVISCNYALICYGCRKRSEINELLNDESNWYKTTPGPFKTFPSSILEDLIQIINDKRGLPRESLHHLILPQLQGYKMYYRTSRQLQTQLLAKQCSNLKSLIFTNCKSLDPIFFTKFLTNFPLLINLDLEDTIIDDEAFSSIGQFCPNLRDLNVNGTTISDVGLRNLIGSGKDTPVSKLVSFHILHTRLSSEAVAFFLISHPNLLQLRMDNMCLVFIRLKEYLENGLSDIYGPNTRLNLRTLSFSEGVVDEEGVKTGVSLCPSVDKLTIRQTDLSSGILNCLRNLTGLNSLHLGNSSFTQHIIDFKEGIVPVLSCLPNLKELTLEKINKVDVLIIGELCKKIRFLKLCCIGSYLPVFGNISASEATAAERRFMELEELVILNTRGAHLFTKTLMSLLTSSTLIKHIRFQFVDTLNDEVMVELLSLNPLSQLQTVIFDQCHSISIFTLDALLSRENLLDEMCVWSCRFITEEDRDTLNEHISLENFALRLDWYPFTGEEAPMPIEDIELLEELEDEEEDDEGVDDGEGEEGNVGLNNYWSNNIPLHQFREISTLD